MIPQGHENCPHCLQVAATHVPPKDVLLVGYLRVFEQPHPQRPDRRGFYCYKQLVIVPIEPSDS